MLNWKLTFLFLLGVQFCYAQETNTYFHHLTVEKGLSEASSLYSYKDSRGFVWISSLSGLNRFDGRQVRVYQPESADSLSLFGQNIQSRFFEDKNGDIWFTTYEGLNRYIRKSDNFQHFTVVNPRNQTSYADYRVAALDKDNQLWLLVNGKTVYTFDIHKQAFTKKHDTKGGYQLFTVERTKEGQVKRSFANIWSSGNFGVEMTEYLSGGKIQQEILFDKTSKTPLSILHFHFENEGVWLGSDKGLSHYDFKTKNLENFYLNSYVSAIVPLNASEFLLSAYSKGLYIFNKNDGTQRLQLSFSEKNTHSLASKITSIAHLDDERNYWLYAPLVGTSFTNFSKTKFRTIYTQASHLHLAEPFIANSLAITSTSDLMSGSYQKGIRLFDKNKILKDSFINGTVSARGLASNSYVQGFNDTKGRIWFLNLGYLDFFDEKTGFFKTIDRKGAFPLYAITTHSGKILVSTFGGIMELVETSKDNFDFKPLSNISNEKPHTIIFEDNDQAIWGSYDATSIRIYDSKNNYALIKELPISGVITGFWHQPNSSIIWMCSQNGLYKIDKTNWQLTVYTETSGLSSRAINAMQADKKGNLWLGTTKGIAKFDPSLNRAHTYNLVDGISDLNTNMYASTQAADGTIYFGTSNGITYFHPDKITPLSILARPTITDLLINDQKAKGLRCVKTGALNLTEIEHLRLPFDQNTLSFTFSAMEYADPERCQFQYKMEGVDKDWVEAGTQNFTRYASLKAGTYRFWLKASNSDGIWNEKPRLLTLTIVPPFYQTWWFLTLVALALLGIAWYSYRLYWQRKYRIIQLQLEKEIALNDERQRIAADMHDDIGSDLSALNLKAEMIRHKAKAGLPLDADITNLVDFTRDIAKKVREVIWTVNARHDSLSSIINYFDHYADEFFDPTPLVVRTSLPPQIPKVNINGEARKILLMCFKESLNNLHKHAQATEVKLDFTVDNQQFTLTVADNGKGFDPSLLTNPNPDKNGLAHLPKRMKSIGGDCQISTSPQGTTLRFSLPVEES
jgi:signal transduction histidine kinase/ligand-binding sensor domain-containing protein